MSDTTLERYKKRSPYWEYMDDAAASYRQGESIRDIVTWTGASYGSVRTMLIRAGVTLRPPRCGRVRKV